jgi:hypothetical protein
MLFILNRNTHQGSAVISTKIENSIENNRQKKKVNSNSLSEQKTKNKKQKGIQAMSLIKTDSSELSIVFVFTLLFFVKI